MTTETNESTEQFIARASAYCAKATPGKWKLATSNSWRRFISEDFGTTHHVVTPFPLTWSEMADLKVREDDAEFITNARTDLPEALRRLEASEKRVRELEWASARLMNNVDELMFDSAGVAGLHLNGDVAPWEDLVEGGRFEEWLSGLEDLRRALKNETPEEVRKAIEAMEAK